MTAIAAPEVRLSEVRSVAPFVRIELRDPVNQVDLIAEPGEPQVLVVEGPAATLHRVQTVVDSGILRITLATGVADHVRDALAPGHQRRVLVYRVQAPRLDEVRVAGLVSVSVAAFGADAPVVTRIEPQVPARS